MKKRDKRGALEKFIDNYHSRQTFVFVVLDNEVRASAIKDRLVHTPSKYADRTITTEELIHLWDKSVEVDNFDHEETAQAMTELTARVCGFRNHMQTCNTQQPAASDYESEGRRFESCRACF